MIDTYEQFIKESHLAGQIKLPGKVVVRRTQLCPREIAAIRQKGVYVPGADETCDLVVGGQVIATGSIIEKDGVCFFQPSAKAREEKK